jgi:RNA polymerase sigma factor (TIGR02999 family)
VVFSGWRSQIGEHGNDRSAISEERVTPEQEGVTQVLLQMSGGDRSALDRLLPLIYEELRAIARRTLRQERPDHTLTPTALVHEAFLKLVQLERVDWRGRAHFFGACSAEMRRILVSYARMRHANKRGGAAARMVTLEDIIVAAHTRPGDVLSLDEALERLAALDPRQARIVEHRFFVGMTVDDTAEALGISPATVKREWALARAWLNRELAP